MKAMKPMLAITCAAALTGCVRLGLPDVGPQPVVTPRPLTLTTESIMQAPDGNRIVVHYPRNVEQPVVVKDDSTGQWVTAAKIR